MNRRILLTAGLSGMMAAALPWQLNGQSASREGTPPSRSKEGTPPVTESYKYALASRVWRDDIDRPKLRLASNIYWMEDATFAKDMYFSWLSDLPAEVSGDDYAFVRVLAQGEYRLPPSNAVPRLDVCGIRTSTQDDYTEGVFVYSLCGNLVSAHYTLVVNRAGGWESDADELIYQCLSRMQPPDGDRNRDAVMSLLPSKEEAENLGMPELHTEQYIERYIEKPEIRAMEWLPMAMNKRK